MRWILLLLLILVTVSGQTEEQQTPLEVDYSQLSDTELAQLQGSELNENIDKIIAAGKLGAVDPTQLSKENLEKYAGQLSSSQIGSLTSDQVYSLLSEGKFPDLQRKHLNKGQISSLTSDQVYLLLNDGKFPDDQKIHLSSGQIIEALTKLDVKNKPGELTKLGKLSDYNNEDLRKALEELYGTTSCKADIDSSGENTCDKLSFNEETSFDGCEFTDTGAMKCGSTIIDMESLRGGELEFKTDGSIIYRREGNTFEISGATSIAWRNGRLIINGIGYPASGELKINVRPDGKLEVTGNGRLGDLKITPPKRPAAPPVFKDNQWWQDTNGDGFYDAVGDGSCNPNEQTCSICGDQSCNPGEVDGFSVDCKGSQKDPRCPPPMRPPAQKPIVITPPDTIPEPAPEPAPTPEPSPAEPPIDPCASSLGDSCPPDATPGQETEIELPKDQDDVQVCSGSACTVDMGTGGGTAIVKKTSDGSIQFGYTAEQAGVMRLDDPHTPIALEFPDPKRGFAVVTSPRGFTFTPQDGGRLTSNGNGLYSISNGEAYFPLQEILLASAETSVFAMEGARVTAIEMGVDSKVHGEIFSVQSRQHAYTLYLTEDILYAPTLDSHSGAVEDALFLQGAGNIQLNGIVQFYERNPSAPSGGLPLITAAAIAQPSQEPLRLVYDGLQESNQAKMRFSSSTQLERFSASSQAQGTLFELYTGHHLYRETSHARLMHLSATPMTQLHLGEYATTLYPEPIRGENMLHIQEKVQSPDPESEPHSILETLLFLEGTKMGFISYGS